MGAERPPNIIKRLGKPAKSLKTCRYKPRLDAGGLLKVFKDLILNEQLFSQVLTLKAPAFSCQERLETSAFSDVSRHFKAFRRPSRWVFEVEMHIVNAAFEGLSLWANDHDEAASLIHRDQLRGLAALLLSPVLAEPERPQPYEVLSRVMRLVAWMPAEGRRELQELMVEDCSEEDVLRSLVHRVRSHCDETVRRAHQMQRLSPEIWEGLMPPGRACQVWWCCKSWCRV